MKQKLIILFNLLLIILIFKNYNIVLDSTINGCIIFLYKVFPYLFIISIINDLLINLNIINYFNKPYIYIFITSLISGTPASTLTIKSLYNNNYISLKYANISLMYSSMPNPLFLYTILYNIFNNNHIVIKLIIIIYLSNLIIIFKYKKELDTNIIIRTNNNISLSNSINKSLNTSLLVLGTICFYLVISNILFNYIDINIYLNILIKGLIELTQGLNSLIDINILFKELISIIFISFMGLSIHTQVKAILEDTKLEYKYYFIGRIYALIISIILTMISYTCRYITF